MVPMVEAQTQQEIDPWEGYNRWMFDFNGDTDRLIIRPVAKGYDAIMPEFGRIGVNNPACLCCARQRRIAVKL